MVSEPDRQLVMSHLFDVCSQRSVSPLIARDFGSRSRNLDNDESDYDVMVVFVPDPVDAVIGTDSDHFEDTIPVDETPLDAEIEVSAWSLRKFIGNDGLSGSNPTALEFVFSDEQYYVQDGTETLFSDLFGYVSEEFKPYALMNNYRSMADSHYGKYIEEKGTVDRTVKRYLNITQALCRGRYVEETRLTPTPLDFTQFLRDVSDEDWIPEKIYSEIGALVAEKKTNSGADGRRDVVDDWIESELDRDVGTDGLVDRGPETETVRGFARDIYEVAR